MSILYNTENITNIPETNVNVFNKTTVRTVTVVSIDANFANLSQLFENCPFLETVFFPDDYEGLNVSSVHRMYADCPLLTTVSMANFKGSNAGLNVDNMFTNSNFLTNLFIHHSLLNVITLPNDYVHVNNYKWVSSTTENNETFTDLPLGHATFYVLNATQDTTITYSGYPIFYYEIEDVVPENHYIGINTVFDLDKTKFLIMNPKISHIKTQLVDINNGIPYMNNAGDILESGKGYIMKINTFCKLMFGINILTATQYENDIMITLQQNVAATTLECTLSFNGIIEFEQTVGLSDAVTVDFQNWNKVEDAEFENNKVYNFELKLNNHVLYSAMYSFIYTSNTDKFINVYLDQNKSLISVEMNNTLKPYEYDLNSQYTIRLNNYDSFGNNVETYAIYPYAPFNQVSVQTFIEVNLDTDGISYRPVSQLYNTMTIRVYVNENGLISEIPIDLGLYNTTIIFNTAPVTITNVTYTLNGINATFNISKVVNEPDKPQTFVRCIYYDNNVWNTDNISIADTITLTFSTYGYKYILFQIVDNSDVVISNSYISNFELEPVPVSITSGLYKFRHHHTHSPQTQHMNVIHLGYTINNAFFELEALNSYTFKLKYDGMYVIVNVDNNLETTEEKDANVPIWSIYSEFLFNGQLLVPHVDTTSPVNENNYFIVSVNTGSLYAFGPSWDPSTIFTSLNDTWGTSYDFIKYNETSILSTSTLSNITIVEDGTGFISDIPYYAFSSPDSKIVSDNVSSELSNAESITISWYTGDSNNGGMTPANNQELIFAYYIENTVSNIALLQIDDHILLGTISLISSGTLTTQTIDINYGDWDTLKTATKFALYQTNAPGDGFVRYGIKSVTITHIAPVTDYSYSMVKPTESFATLSRSARKLQKYNAPTDGSVLTVPPGMCVVKIHDEAMVETYTTWLRSSGESTVIFVNSENVELGFENIINKVVNVS